MTEPTDQEIESLSQPVQGGANYASDRHLLLQEIKTLAKEVGRLRGDTKYLNDVIIPKEEHARRRKVNSILAGLSLLLFALAAGGLYVQAQQIDRTQDDLKQTAYETCISRNEATVRGGQALLAVNDLLGTFRDTEEGLKRVDEPQVTEVRDARIKALNDYLTFVAQSASEPSVMPPDCEDFRR